MPAGPIADYRIKLSNGNFVQIGYDAVGPGWHPILEILDQQLQSFVEYAVQHATVVKEEYRDTECQVDATIRVAQVKEKFGSLRVYIEHKGLGTRIGGFVEGAVRMAEALSLRTCEKCGAVGRQHGTITERPRRGFTYGRVMTLCDTHRRERESCQEKGIPFEVGNGDRV